MPPKRPSNSSAPTSRAKRVKSSIQDVKVVKVPNPRGGRGAFTIVATRSAKIGDSGVIDGVRYTIRGESQLRALIRQNKWNDVVRTCTSRITNMRYLFKDTAVNLDIGHWDTSSVRDMAEMFYNADAFNQPIGAWNTSRVKNMRDMFPGAISFNKSIARWNTSSVMNMRGMFEFTTAFNQDISHWADRLPENVNRAFAKMMIGGDVRKTVRRLRLNRIFDRRPSDLPIRSVEMVKIVRETYPGYRPSQIEYENLHDLLRYEYDNLLKKRVIALIDFLNREEANLRPSMRYNKTKSRSIIRNINQRTNRKRMTALASIDRSAARKNLHIPKEIMSQILHAASLKVLPYTHARGVNRRTGNGM